MTTKHYLPKFDITTGERKGLLALLCIMLVIAFSLALTRNSGSLYPVASTVSASSDTPATVANTEPADSVIDTSARRTRKKKRAVKKQSPPPVTRHPRNETVNK